MNDRTEQTTNNDAGVTAAPAYPEADLIVQGGPIVTVAPDADGSGPECVAVKDGLIVFAGSLQDAAEAWEGPHTRRHDLQGQALLPGFIDAHGHLGGIGLQDTIANLLAAPDGDVTDIASLRRKLTEWAETPVGMASTWIIGFGYDDAMLTEKEHPTRDDLDKVSRDRPVLAIHQSFHLGAVNSKGLELLGYSRSTADPDAGVIRRRPDSPEHPFARPFGDPNGVLEETAFTKASDEATGSLPLDALALLFSKGVAVAASFGFTTVQEGGTTLKNISALRGAALLKAFKIDVVAYAKAEEAMKALAAQPDKDPIGASQDYKRGVRVAGVKMVLDGSPQGRTAWLKKAYLERPEGTPEGYLGYPAIADDEEVLAQVSTAYAQGWQLLAHVNGDAAIGQFIDAVQDATAQAGAADRRTVAVHAQTAGEDQLDKFAELGIIPSFFSMHTFYWGDWYVDTVLGPDRAANISPAKWALDRGLVYTSHHDAPVALPDSIAILSSQVTRRTRTSGTVLGPEQRVTALEALKAITINAAHQYFEEDSKGSIEVGKLADLVVLSENPLTVDPDEIRNITVIQTFKKGQSVYSADAASGQAPEAPGADDPGEAPADFEWHGCC